MTDRELMQMALDALEEAQSYTSSEIWSPSMTNECAAAAEALRAALAQPEQEIESDRPHVENDGCPTEKAVLQRFWREHQKQEPVRLQCVTCGTVYADGVPPQVAQREWVGLTLDEIFDSTHGFTRIQKDDWVATDTDIAEFAHIIEARLKAKNT